MGKFSDALRAEIASYDDNEWTGNLGPDQVTLYSKPLTPADMRKIGRDHPNFAQVPTLEGMVDLLILKCHDGDDHKAFDKGDKPLLMRCGANKIGDIFGALFGDQISEYTDEDLDDDVKN